MDRLQNCGFKEEKEVKMFPSFNIISLRFHLCFNMLGVEGTSALLSRGK